MVKIDKSLTASFDVDPQCGFTPLCPDELPVNDGHLIADALNNQALFAKFRIVSKDCHPTKAPWIAQTIDEIMTPVEGQHVSLDIKWPAHCVVGTKGNRLIPGLPNESNYDLVIEKGIDPLKHPYGACYHDLLETEETGIIEWLQKHQVNTVIVGGLATDYCVKITVIQLCNAGFNVIVNSSACRGIAEQTIHEACLHMSKAGAIIINDSNELALI